MVKKQGTKMEGKVSIPPAAQSTEPHSIRFTPDQWAEITEMARRRSEEPSRLVRRLTLMALSIVQAQARAEASLTTTGMGRL